MERIMIINGSPRAPKSNSKTLANLFSTYSTVPTDYFSITKSNHADLLQRMPTYSDLLFVFPLYADGIPSGMLDFLKHMEQHPPQQKPVLSILINCGFLEYQQNETAVRMMKLFCKQNNYKVGSVLMIGSGEAILKTPFKYLVKRKIKQLARSINQQSYQTLHTAMPISKHLFKMAATIYWTRYGKKFGTSPQAMRSMHIEP